MSTPARRGSRLLGLALAVALAAVTALFSSGVASAHAYLRGSDPAEGTTVQALPATVTLDFNETIHNFEPVVVVTGPDGKNYATGTVSVVGNVVSTAVSTGAPAGAYSMAYRVVSADGHPVEGQVRFTVAAPVSSSAAPSSSSPAPSTRASSSASATPPRSSTPQSSTPQTSTPRSSTAPSSAASISTPGSSAASTGPTAGSAAGGSAASSSAAPSTSGSAVVSSSAPETVVEGVGSQPVETSSGPDWWIWVAIAVAAVILAVAGFITLRKPRED